MFFKSSCCERLCFVLEECRVYVPLPCFQIELETWKVSQRGRESQCFKMSLSMSRHEIASASGAQVCFHIGMLGA